MATSRVCSIPDCGKRHHARGYCNMHMRRLRLTGTTAPRIDPSRQALNNLLASIANGHINANECVLWTGCISGNGYGSVRFRGARLGAHRVAYMLVNGDPTGMVVRHTCDNPLCVNPLHLILGTHADNTRDCVVRGRRAVGKKMPHAKLTAEKAVEIFLSNETATALAARFGVGRTLIRRIKRRQKWQHATSKVASPSAPPNVE